MPLPASSPNLQFPTDIFTPFPTSLQDSLHTSARTPEKRTPGTPVKSHLPPAAMARDLTETRYGRPRGFAKSWGRMTCFCFLMSLRIGEGDMYEGGECRVGLALGLWEVGGMDIGDMGRGIFRVLVENGDGKVGVGVRVVGGGGGLGEDWERIGRGCHFKEAECYGGCLAVELGSADGVLDSNCDSNGFRIIVVVNSSLSSDRVSTMLRGRRWGFNLFLAVELGCFADGLIFLRSFKNCYPTAVEVIEFNNQASRTCLRVLGCFVDFRGGGGNRQIVTSHRRGNLKPSAFAILGAPRNTRMVKLSDTAFPSQLPLTIPHSIPSSHIHLQRIPSQNLRLIPALVESPQLYPTRCLQDEVTLRGEIATAWQIAERDATSVFGCGPEYFGDGNIYSADSNIRIFVASWVACTARLDCDIGFGLPNRLLCGNSRLATYRTGKHHRSMD
ncbi:hypothetical protein BJ508DRAFT_381068 [Ascobolus immersus RN42]|uniref:Uncharacterized protein n=1 Tax=Ascobolus immersus RN42 TaxID=1160509 RepID=A0A3N4HHE5_ASCIM|nr:hypothetical protein BJ508DRAFT_381068 [Ascobolus immersus RN42]